MQLPAFASFHSIYVQIFAKNFHGCEVICKKCERFSLRMISNIRYKVENSGEENFDESWITKFWYGKLRKTHSSLHKTYRFKPKVMLQVEKARQNC